MKTGVKVLLYIKLSLKKYIYEPVIVKNYIKKGCKNCCIYKTVFS